MRRTLPERKKLAEVLPWVKQLKKPTPCDGIKWSTVALGDIYSIGNKPARGIQDRSRCKRQAYWHFTKLKRNVWGKSGNYCWTHLTMQLHDYEEERVRYMRYLEKRGLL